MSHRAARALRRTVDDARDEPRRPELAPEMLTRLQRSAGNAAVSRLLQRKFGFEVETNIGLRNIAEATFVKKDQPPWAKAATEQKTITAHPDVTAEDAVGTGAPHFTIKVDHHLGHGVTDAALKDLKLQSQNVLGNPSSKQVSDALEYDEPAEPKLRGPIAEFVTDPPLDEFAASESEVRDAMTSMGAAAIKLKTASTRAPLADHYAGTVQPGVRVGVKGKANTIGDLQKQVAIQTTVGIQLEHVQQYFREQSKSPPITDPGKGKVWEPSGDKSAFVEALAVHNGTQLMTTLRLDPATYPEWTGAMTLLSQYLLATLYPAGFGWGKNQVGMFFYKSRLNDVFAGLTASDVKKYKNVLLQVNRVDPGALIGGSIPAGEWLEEVLGSKQDRVFDALKNPYSSALGPERIGPKGNRKTAAVMEKRKGGPPLPPGTSWASQDLETSAKAWGDLGVLVYNYIRDLHGA